MEIEEEIKKQKIIHRIVEKLLIAVEEQKERVGYYFFGGLQSGV